MSLRPPEKVRKLQSTLHAKAKEAPGFRFYSLHDKIDREDVLAYAYRLSRHNGGAPGNAQPTLQPWLSRLFADLPQLYDISASHH